MEYVGKASHTKTENCHREAFFKVNYQHQEKSEVWGCAGVS